MSTATATASGTPSHSSESALLRRSTSSRSGTGSNQSAANHSGRPASHASSFSVSSIHRLDTMRTGTSTLTTSRTQSTSSTMRSCVAAPAVEIGNDPTENPTQGMENAESAQPLEARVPPGEMACRPQPLRRRQEDSTIRPNTCATRVGTVARSSHGENADSEAPAKRKARLAAPQAACQVRATRSVSFAVSEAPDTNAESPGYLSPSPLKGIGPSVTCGTSAGGLPDKMKPPARPCGPIENAFPSALIGNMHEDPVAEAAEIWFDAEVNQLHHDRRERNLIKRFLSDEDDALRDPKHAALLHPLLAMHGSPGVQSGSFLSVSFSSSDDAEPVSPFSRGLSRVHRHLRTLGESWSDNAAVNGRRGEPLDAEVAALASGDAGDLTSLETAESMEVLRELRGLKQRMEVFRERKAACTGNFTHSIDPEGAAPAGLNGDVVKEETALFDPERYVAALRRGETPPAATQAVVIGDLGQKMRSELRPDVSVTPAELASAWELLKYRIDSDDKHVQRAIRNATRSSQPAPPLAQAATVAEPPRDAAQGKEPSAPQPTSAPLGELPPPPATAVPPAVELELQRQRRLLEHLLKSQQEYLQSLAAQRPELADGGDRRSHPFTRNSEERMRLGPFFLTATPGGRDRVVLPPSAPPKVIVIDGENVQRTGAEFVSGARHAGYSDGSVTRATDVQFSRDLKEHYARLLLLEEQKRRQSDMQWQRALQELRGQLERTQQHALEEITRATQRQHEAYAGRLARELEQREAASGRRDAAAQRDQEVRTKRMVQGALAVAISEGRREQMQERALMAQTSPQQKPRHPLESPRTSPIAPRSRKAAAVLGRRPARPGRCDMPTDGGEVTEEKDVVEMSDAELGSPARHATGAARRKESRTRHALPSPGAATSGRRAARIPSPSHSRGRGVKRTPTSARFANSPYRAQSTSPKTSNRGNSAQSSPLTGRGGAESRLRKTGATASPLLPPSHPLRVKHPKPKESRGNRSSEVSASALSFSSPFPSSNFPPAGQVFSRSTIQLVSDKSSPALEGDCAAESVRSLRSSTGTSASLPETRGGSPASTVVAMTPCELSHRPSRVATGGYSALPGARSWSRVESSKIISTSASAASVASTGGVRPFDAVAVFPLKDPPPLPISTVTEQSLIVEQIMEDQRRQQRAARCLLPPFLIFSDQLAPEERVKQRAVAAAYHFHSSNPTAGSISRNRGGECTARMTEAPEAHSCGPMSWLAPPHDLTAAPAAPHRPPPARAGAGYDFFGAAAIEAAHIYEFPLTKSAVPFRGALLDPIVAQQQLKLEESNLRGTWLRGRKRSTTDGSTASMESSRDRRREAATMLSDARSRLRHIYALSLPPATSGATAWLPGTLTGVVSNEFTPQPGVECGNPEVLSPLQQAVELEVIHTLLHDASESNMLRIVSTAVGQDILGRRLSASLARGTQQDKPAVPEDTAEKVGVEVLGDLLEECIRDYVWVCQLTDSPAEGRAASTAVADASLPWEFERVEIPKLAPNLADATEGDRACQRAADQRSEFAIIVGPPVCFEHAAAAASQEVAISAAAATEAGEVVVTVPISGPAGGGARESTIRVVLDASPIINAFARIAAGQSESVQLHHLELTQQRCQEEETRIRASDEDMSHCIVECPLHPPIQAEHQFLPAASLGVFGAGLERSFTVGGNRQSECESEATAHEGDLPHPVGPYAPLPVTGRGAGGVSSFLAVPTLPSPLLSQQAPHAQPLTPAVPIFLSPVAPRSQPAPPEIQLPPHAAQTSAHDMEVVANMLLKYQQDHLAELQRLGRENIDHQEHSARTMLGYLAALSAREAAQAARRDMTETPSHGSSAVGATGVPHADQGPREHENCRSPARDPITRFIFEWLSEYEQRSAAARPGHEKEDFVAALQAAEVTANEKNRLVREEAVGREVCRRLHDSLQEEMSEKLDEDAREVATLLRVLREIDQESDSASDISSTHDSSVFDDGMHRFVADLHPPLPLPHLDTFMPLRGYSQARGASRAKPADELGVNTESEDDGGAAALNNAASVSVNATVSTATAAAVATDSGAALTGLNRGPRRTVVAVDGDHRSVSPAEGAHESRMWSRRAPTVSASQSTCTTHYTTATEGDSSGTSWWRSGATR